MDLGVGGVLHELGRQHRRDWVRPFSFALERNSSSPSARADPLVVARSLRSGIGFFFVGLATLIGSPIAGALLAATDGSYVAALCFGGGMAVLGCALLVLGRATQVRRRSSQWV